MALVEVPTEPFKKVAMDLKVLGEADSKGYTYILVIIDYLSKHVTLEALRTKTAKAVTQAFLQRHVSIFGVPDVVVSDGGSEFDNALLDDVLRRLQAAHFVTVAHRPQGNGQVERCMSCLLYTSPSPRDLSTSRMPSSA